MGNIKLKVALFRVLLWVFGFGNAAFNKGLA